MHHNHVLIGGGPKAGSSNEPVCFEATRSFGILIMATVAPRPHRLEGLTQAGTKEEASRSAISKCLIAIKRWLKSLMKRRGCRPPAAPRHGDIYHLTEIRVSTSLEWSTRGSRLVIRRCRSLCDCAAGDQGPGEHPGNKYVSPSLYGYIIRGAQYTCPPTAECTWPFVLVMGFGRSSRWSELAGRDDGGLLRPGWSDYSLRIGLNYPDLW